MKISVIGCGYLGAVHAAAMAELGHDVFGIDTNPERIAALGSGKAPFHEPGLNQLLRSNSNRLSFSRDISLISDASVHFLAVGTPQSSDGSVEMSFVEEAIENLLPYLSKGDLIVGKSTVPVGTASRIENKISPSGAKLIWNLEFLREGFAVRDTLSPDRLVYGVSEKDSKSLTTEVLDEVYRKILDNGTPRLVMDFATAELVKVAANSFLATKISFINAMSEIADEVGADIKQLADAIGHDDRIGRKFLNAGIGFGGGCLPKDIRGFIFRSEELGLDETLNILREVDKINLRSRKRVGTLLREELGDLKDKKIAVWGISFKPDSDDIRDSPALYIAESLVQDGATVVAADPKGFRPAEGKLSHLTKSGGLSLTEDHESAVEGAQALVVATEWEIFKNANPKKIGSLMEDKIVIDGRNCLESASWIKAGFVYRGIGRLAR